MICCFRVYLEYHTTAQVVLGGIVGVLSGSLWFAVVQFVATPLFPHIASWWVIVCVCVCVGV